MSARRALLALVLLAACRGEPRDLTRGTAADSAAVDSTISVSPGSPPADSARPDTTPVAADTTTALLRDTAAWTVGIVERTRATGVATLVAVRAARHDGFDRVVFELTGERPGIHVEYVDRPVRDCGAGQVVPVAGDGWLAVRFTPTNAHDEEGRATAGPRTLRTALPVVIEIVRTCDFEAVTEHVLGVASPNRYRVLELSDPVRVVVDVRHGR